MANLVYGNNYDVPERKFTNIHVVAQGPSGVQNLSYDEEEFNDGTTNLQEMLKDLIDEGNTRLIIEINIEE